MRPLALPLSHTLPFPNPQPDIPLRPRQHRDLHVPQLRVSLPDPVLRLQIGLQRQQRNKDQDLGSRELARGTHVWGGSPGPEARGDDFGFGRCGGRGGGKGPFGGRLGLDETIRIEHVGVAAPDVGTLVHWFGGEVHVRAFLEQVLVVEEMIVHHDAERDLRMAETLGFLEGGE